MSIEVDYETHETTKSVVKNQWKMETLGSLLINLMEDLLESNLGAPYFHH